MRGAEYVVEAAQKGLFREKHMMLEDTGHLPRQGIFGDAVVVVKACLRAPTDIPVSYTHLDVYKRQV